VLFRREIVLNYARIQDINLRANLLERWLGLARVELQTAAGSAGAEMTLEGLSGFEAVRDFLYDRMRGARESRPATGRAGASAADELAAVLREVAVELRALHAALAPAAAPPPAAHE
jgi:putative membrane protein